MLNVFYALLFRSESLPRQNLTGLSTGGLACFVLACNAAGQLHLGVLGLLGFIVLFLALGATGCYWYVASIHLLVHGMGFAGALSHQECPRGSQQPWFIALQGLWPLILLGSAVSAQRWWPTAGTVLTLMLLFTLGFTLVAAIRRAYGTKWYQAALCLGCTAILGSLALVGIIGWPFMFLFGAKHFSIAIPI